MKQYFNNFKSLHSKLYHFIIPNRISSIKNADIIYVIKNGRLIERITHEELLFLHGEYCDFISLEK